MQVFYLGGEQVKKNKRCRERGGENCSKEAAAVQCGFQSKATRTPEKVGEEELFVKYPTGWKRVG